MGLALVVNDSTNAIKLYSDNPQAHLSEAERMNDIVQGYLTSDKGQDFSNYVASRGKRFVKINGVGAGDLGENTVAAIIHDGLEGVILSNYNGVTFSERVGEMASTYGIGQEAMTEYVITHELAHAAGCKSEAETEGFVKEYFEQKAFKSQGEDRQRYVKLAGIAAKREAEARNAGK